MSDLRVNTVSDAAGTGPVALTKQSAAKAYVHFNGKSTAAVVESFNTSSLTDNGTGDFTVGLTNAMNTATYAVADHCYVTASSAWVAASMWASKTTTAVNARTLSTGFGYVDSESCSGIIMGDLA